MLVPEATEMNKTKSLSVLVGDNHGIIIHKQNMREVSRSLMGRNFLECQGRSAQERNTYQRKLHLIYRGRKQRV